MAPRTLIVSNRLPVTASVDAGHVSLVPSAGGLATGLRGVHDASGGQWIGWSGLSETLAPTVAEELRDRYRGLRVVPVDLTQDEVSRFYEGYSNGVLWPLMHSFPAQLPLEVHDEGAYEAVNARFADEVVRQHRPGDLIWIHDYQLMRVPALVRARIPDARIGFFLHIPFPSPDVFRILPQRERLLEGLLGADLIGFHTAVYMRRFSSSVLRILGALADVDRIAWKGRTIELGIFPMGIDATSWDSAGRAPEVLAEAETYRQPGSRLLVGVDRLDYTKGLPRRLLAFELLLRRHPEWRERVRLVQLAVPSRTSVDAYRKLRGQMDQLAGRINAEFATPRWVPVHYLYRGLSPPEVAALYRAADALLVTPIRDGMNLVAKEFIAARSDEGGVVVLSEFTGAAAELAEAVHVNPYDLEGTAEAIHRALVMPGAQVRARMAGLRARVLEHDVHRWAASFLDRLGSRSAHPIERVATPATVLAASVERLRAASHLVLLLDYDGTLVPFAETPDLAFPDPEVLALLERLAARLDRSVHVVSGRSRASLDTWLGDLPIGLFAEHGAWSRLPGDSWRSTLTEVPAWMEPVRRILEEFAGRTPGSLVEPKSSGLAWHYRMSDPEYGPRQARDLMAHLASMLSNTPAEVLLGDRVVEVRGQGIHKGLSVPFAVARAPSGSALLAIGDDVTDEDLFSALPPEGLAAHVGSSESRAALRLADVTAVRALLSALAGDGVP